MSLIDTWDLGQMASSQLQASTRIIRYIARAADMPYCKRHILETKLLFWQKAMIQLCEAVLYEKDCRREANLNQACKKFLLKNKLAHKDFLDFFFSIHEPLTLAMIRNTKTILKSDLSKAKKIDLVLSGLTELLNISKWELIGLDISCDVFGGKPACMEFGGCAERECRGPSNTFRLLMCTEYFMEPGLFENIITNASKYDLSQVVVIIDYTAMRENQTSYDWANAGGEHRRKVCKKFVKEMYYYNTEGFVNFGEFYDEIKHLLIPSKHELDHLRRTWRDQKELVYYA